MDKKARVAGYALTLFLLGALLWLVWTLQEGFLLRRNEIRVRFPEIGTLMQDDAVKMRGVEIGRVARIESVEGEPVVTLELYRRTPLPKDSRFINYNYSLFGARMVVAVPGHSPEPIDASRIHQGYFSSGVTESIHRVEQLLRTVLEYRNLSARLERGGAGTASLQELLTTRVYPALDEVGRFSRQLDALQSQAGSQLDDLSRMSAEMGRFSSTLGPQSDTMLVKAGHAVEQLTRLTGQATVVIHSLERILLAAEDTSSAVNRLVTRRDIYDQTMQLSRDLQVMLKLLKQDGLQDVIRFWTNVRFRKRK